MKPDTWEVIANEDGSFALLRQGQLLHGSIPDRWLEEELAKYGFCGQEYRDIRQQLKARGRATVPLNRIRL